MKKEINYKQVKEIREGSYLTVSVKLLSKNIDCTANGRKICDGRCCKGHVNTKQKGKIFVRYTKEELESFPEEIQKEIKTHTNNELVVQNEEGICSMLSFCLKNPVYKPIECKLFPFVFNKQGRLVVDRWAIFHCPNFGKGEPSYITLKDNLIDVFGNDCYKSIVKQIEEKKESVDEWM